ncbi:hypothetical protein G9A89_014146 [Geosiphon pyriformis]|nr:hypothetical protein G9A89_014146 [Geosiphon pyriformis]
MNLSLTDRLLELKNAHERGLLGDEEYTRIRTRLLDSFTNILPLTTVCRPTPPPIPPPRSSTLSQNIPGAPKVPPRSTSVINMIKIRAPPEQQRLLENTSVELFSSPSLPPTNVDSPSSSQPSIAGICLNTTPTLHASTGRQSLSALTFLRKHDRLIGVTTHSLTTAPSNSTDLSTIREYGQTIPEIPPPPYTPPESCQSRRYRPSSFFKVKSSAELRKELKKLTDDAKREQDSWKMQEATLTTKMGTKPEELERIRKKMRDSSEKYQRKIESVRQKMRHAMLTEETP